MAISTEITKQPKSSIEIKVQVDAAEVDQTFSKTYQEIAPKIRVNGFRPGKAPISVIKMKYGSSIKAEVLDKLIQAGFQAALEEHDLHPVSKGELAGELPELEEGTAFHFAIKIDVFPEITLPEYKGIAVSRNKYEVKDKDVEAELKNLQDRFSKLEEVADGQVKKDNYALVNYTVEVDGEVLDSYNRENYLWDQAAGASFPDFKKELIGKKAGDSVTVNSSFPKDFADETLAGKSAKFSVDIIKVQERIIPEIDEEFVKKIAQAESVEDFKKQLRENMEEHAKNRESREAQTEIMTFLGKETKVDIPDSMVESEIDSMVAEFRNTLQYSRTTLDEYLENAGKSEAELREDFRESAVQQVITMLALNEIGKKEEIEAGEDDINGEVEMIARRYGQPGEMLRGYLEQNGQLESIIHGIKRRKTLELLEEMANIKTAKTISISEIKD